MIRIVRLSRVTKLRALLRGPLAPLIRMRNSRPSACNPLPYLNGKRPLNMVPYRLNPWSPLTLVRLAKLPFKPMKRERVLIRLHVRKIIHVMKRKKHVIRRPTWVMDRKPYRITQWKLVWLRAWILLVVRTQSAKLLLLLMRLIVIREAQLTTHKFRQMYKLNRWKDIILNMVDNLKVSR